MADWSYVVLAYGVVWGAVAAYTLMLRRRITRSRASVEQMRQTIDDGSSTARQEDPACDTASIP